jgi:hypothetical protein
VPLVVILALLLGGSPSSTTPHPSDSVLPPVTASAPPDSAAATVSTCARVISALPLKLNGLALRRTESDPPSSSIVAWGDPAIVLRCGVARPAALNPALSEQLFAINGVLFLPKRSSSQTVWTAVDRPVYVDVAVPTSYHQPPLGPIASAIAKVLPKPVCVQDPAKPRADQCTRRK